MSDEVKFVNTVMWWVTYDCYASVSIKELFLTGGCSSTSVAYINQISLIDKNITKFLLKYNVERLNAFQLMLITLWGSDFWGICCWHLDVGLHFQLW